MLSALVIEIVCSHARIVVLAPDAPYQGDAHGAESWARVPESAIVRIEPRSRRAACQWRQLEAGAPAEQHAISGGGTWQAERPMPDGYVLLERRR